MNNHNNNILLSIRCFVYNHEHYLRQCLEGFVMQKTNFAFEAIVHDDASTDNSAAIIREYAENFPDIIKPIYETENQYSKHDGSIRRIVDNAIAPSTKYVALCEGDDYWTDPYKLQKQVDYLEAHPECGLCYTDINVFDEEKNTFYNSALKNGIMRKSRDFDDHLLNLCYIAPLTWVYRKSVMDKIGTIGYHTDGTYAIALDFYQHSEIHYLNIVSAVYRKHLGSASNPQNDKSKFLYLKGVYDTQFQYAAKYGYSDDRIKLLRINSILNLLPLAIKCKDKEYIDDSLDYCDSVGTNLRRYYGIYLDRNNLMNSPSFKLGSFILKPIKLLLNIKYLIKTHKK